MAERTTQTFMALLTRERIEEALSQEGSHGSKVVEKYVTETRSSVIRKVTFFMHMKKLCEFVKMGLSMNLCDFYSCV